MSRYRLILTTAQRAVLQDHCADARFVWNMAVEQQSHWRPGKRSAPGYPEQCRQLTEARTEHEWLRRGSQVVQQQALRDFAYAMANFFAGTHRRPTWRKAGRNEGFRVVAVKPGHIRRLSRKIGVAWIPKVGWVRFRWSRAVPDDVRSYRITLDRAGRWHIAFATIPEPIQPPGAGSVVGVDRGIVVSAALSTGVTLVAPQLSRARQRRLRLLKQRLTRTEPGSNRRSRIRRGIARLSTREADARKDWAERISTDLARRFDVIKVENQKAGLNRGILTSGWGLLVRRLEEKAPGRVEKVNPAFTSQRCSACGHIASSSRESQALFRCVACGYACNADVNAARNIAAGHAVTARGGDGVARPVNREPQRLVS